MALTPADKKDIEVMIRKEIKGFLDSNTLKQFETTMPRKMNSGGYVYTMNDGNIVPGPNVNADVVPESKIATINS